MVNGGGDGVEEEEVVSRRVGVVRGEGDECMERVGGVSYE